MKNLRFDADNQPRCWGPSDFVCNRRDLRVHDWESWAGEDYSDDYEH
jgi:hypothetical protein